MFLFTNHSPTSPLNHHPTLHYHHLLSELPRIVLQAPKPGVRTRDHQKPINILTLHREENTKSQSPSTCLSQPTWRIIQTHSITLLLRKTRKLKTNKIYSRVLMKVLLLRPGNALAVLTYQPNTPDWCDTSKLTERVKE